MKTLADMVYNDVAAACEKALKNETMNVESLSQLLRRFEKLALGFPECESVDGIIDGLQEALQYESMRIDEAESASLEDEADFKNALREER